ncbi:phage tail length tape measure family protein [Methylobacterium sp. J-092]|uniref:phage tail length tape measure family protein n=1 Tax=Methylobacterium sp. J-092 TaxID=2836667 RepID=UPI001FB8EC96|nr:phage tail length tape measure family protein [Methylobacterium sp. J-092]MCJ2009808.1 phage tail length tape measure family protein [Methylobacterium sp. J-092]
MTTNIAIRLQAEGSGEIRRAFDEAGNAGKTAFDGVTSALDRTSAASDKVVEKVRQAGEAARTAQGTAAGGGASAPGAAISREVERIRTQLDEEYRKQKQLDRAGSVIDRGYTAGHFDDAERARLTDLASQRYGTAAPRNDNVRGLDSRDRMFIQYSAFSGASSLSAGAGLGSVAVQQGTGIVQHLADREGGLKAGLADLGTSAAALVTPMTVAATATAALGAAFVLAGTQAASDQRVLETATQGIGRATGATVSQLDALARSNAEAGKVSTSTAREIVAGYASTGQIALPVIGDLTRLTQDYARITGQDATSATAELARAFGDLATGADAIAAKVGGLDDKTKQLILTQIEQGDRASAQATAADYLKASVDANTIATTGWAAAWDRAKAAADGYWEAAKRIAGIKLGIVPEGAQAAVDRLQAAVDSTNKTRTAIGMQPLGLGDRQVTELDAAKLRQDTERRIAEGKAAEERANQASTAAGNVARAVDPNYARLEQLRKQQSDLRDALADPLARTKLSDQGQVEDAYTSTTRAISTMTDATGKMISAEEMARRSDQLRIDSLKAKTDAEKASVAERQKAFDLIGKTITPGDARGQIDRAGAISRLESSEKGGKADTDKQDDYDRALKQTENSIRRQAEQAQTYGQSADVVARYRTETELLTAAKRAEREITPELTAQIQSYADQAAEAAKRNEDLKDQMKRTDDFRGVGSDGVRTLVRGLADGTAQGKLFESVLSSIKNRVADLASNSLNDLLFGQRGTSSTGSLGGLFGRMFGLGGGSSGGSGDSGLPNLSFGFEGGGYTGPGGRYDPAGIVHRGEVVFSQDDVRRFGGVDRVEIIRRGGRGYAAGGPVGGFTMPGAMVAASGSATLPAFNLIDQRPAGSGDIDPTAQRRSDGGFDLILRGVEGKLGQRANTGRGPFKQAAGGPAFNQG